MNARLYGIPFYYLSLGVGVLVALAPTQALAGYQVTTVADVQDGGDGLCSLREAFDSVTGVLSDCVLDADTTYDIQLTTVSEHVLSAPIVATLPATVVVQGPVGGGTIRAPFDARAFSFSPAGAATVVTLNRLTLVDALPNPTASSVTGSGGLLALFGDVSLVALDVTLSGGRASTSGGCLHTEGARLSLTNTTVTLCVSGSQGGGVYAPNLSGAGALLLSNVLFTSNTAVSGGALWLGAAIGAPVSPTGSIQGTFSANFASSQGGALSVGPLGLVSMLNSSFSANQAATGGAVFTSARSLTTDATTVFEDNAAVERGGAMLLDAAAGLTVTGSRFSLNRTQANGLGGAIFASGNSEVLIQSSSTFGPNNSAQSGGAIFTEGATLTITGSTFNANGTFPATSPTMLASLGGAIVVSEPCALTASSVTFSANRSTGDAGAIEMDSLSGALIITDALFDANIAGGNGGALSLDGATTANRVTRSVFKNNRAARGGAISNHEALAVEQVTFRENRALTTHGGAISNAADTTDGRGLVVLHSTFFANQAAQEGGAIHNLGFARLNNLSIINNQAGTGGGVVDRSSRTANEYNFLANSVVVRNTASTAPLAHDIFVANASAIDVRSTMIGRADNSGLSPIIAHGLITGTIASPVVDGLTTSPAVHGDANVEQRTFALVVGSAAAKAGGGVVGFACGARHAHTLDHPTPPDVWGTTPVSLDQRQSPRPTGVAGASVTVRLPTVGPVYRCDLGAYEAPRAALQHNIQWSSNPAIAGENAVLVASLSNTLTPVGWLNLPPADAGNQARLVANAPSQMAGASWSCVYGGGAAGPANVVQPLVLTPTALPGGSSATCTLTRALPENARGGLTAVASRALASDSLVLDGSVSSVVTADVGITPLHDLSVALPQLSFSIPRFELVVLEPVVRNDGPSSAENAALLVAPSSAGLQFLPEDSSPDCQDFGGNVTCGPFRLGKDESLARRVVLRATASADAANNVVVSIDNNEAQVAPGGLPTDPEPPTPNADSNEADVTVNVTAASPADLALTVNTEPEVLFAGETLSYVIRTRNFGPGLGAEFATVATLGSADLALLDLQAPAGCAIQPEAAGSVGPFVVTCTCDGPCALAADSEILVRVNTFLHPSTPAGSITNGPPSAARIEARSPAKPADPTTTNDTVDAVSVTFSTKSDVQVAAGFTGLAGDTTSFTAILECAVNNVGPSSADQAALQVDVPSGTTLLDLVAPAGWVCARPAQGSAGTVLCTQAALLPHNGTPDSILLTLQLADDILKVDGTCSFSARTTDPEAANNSASASYERTVVPDKQAGVATQVRGGLSGKGCRCGTSGEAADSGLMLAAALFFANRLRVRLKQ